jgi:predicted pyridoxine 5'-phosphate oxidase superfamily flavin-nucleotide-binding protein
LKSQGPAIGFAPMPIAQAQQRQPLQTEAVDDAESGFSQFTILETYISRIANYAAKQHWDCYQKGKR